MSRLHKYVLSVFIVTACCCLQQQLCAAQQSSTVRPYKFGFTVDEQQHRQESRDERGIVMGEFGFITADGIYHVTVYATDEQGRFRILAMKSYPYKSPPKTVEIMLTPKVVVTTTTTPRAELQRHNFYTEACSGCFLSNGKNKPKGQAGETPKTDIRTLSKDLPTAPKSNIPKTNLATKPKSAAGKPVVAGKPVAGKPSIADTATGNQAQGNPKRPDNKPNTITGQKDIMDMIINEVLPAVIGSKGVLAKPPTRNAPSGKTPSKSLIPTRTAAGNPGRNSLSNSNFNPKSTSSSAGGSGDGDLYRFKYILDYHGHTETGKRNGNKEGNYFAIGDDDIERTIEYVANENGYQPRIHWRKLNHQKGSPPKENTLKDYEFVWFTQN